MQCRELVPVDRLSCVRAFTRLFDALATPENGVAPEEGEGYPLLIEVSAYPPQPAAPARARALAASTCSQPAYQCADEQA